MITTRIQKQDDTYFVVIPDEAMARYHLAEGDDIVFTLNKVVDGRITLSPEMKRTVERVIEEHRDALDYLADR
ncbi:MAG: hypothetical protein QM753_02575 [Thermomicrobiales bacterium]